MKKIFALALVIVMMAAISVPAFAAETSFSGNLNETYENQTKIEYGVQQTYTVVIPDLITINSNLEGSCPVKVQDVCIPANLKIKLSVSSENVNANNDKLWQLEEQVAVDATATGAQPVPYTVKTATIANIERGGQFMEAASAVTFNAVTETLLIQVNKTMQVATYEDYLTFIVSIAA